MDKRIAIVIVFSVTVAATASYIVYAMLVRGASASTGQSGSRVHGRDKGLWRPAPSSRNRILPKAMSCPPFPAVPF